MQPGRQRVRHKFLQTESTNRQSSGTLLSLFVLYRCSWNSYTGVVYFSKEGSNRIVQEEELIAMGRRCMELTDDLWRMPEHTLYRDLQNVDITIEIFHRNYVAFDTSLTFLASDSRAAPFFVVRNHDKFLRAGKEVVFYLHNYVASALSLVDHSRNVYEGRLNQLIQPFPGYKERIAKEFAHDPLARFVIGLRIYCQHSKSPSISVQTTNPGGRLVRKVQLPLSSLLTFSGWSSEAKAYLSTIEGGVDIQQVATIYHDRVIAFHQWVQEQHEKIYAADFQRFREKEREVLLLQLETNIEHHLLALSKGNTLMKRLDVFTHVLSSEDFVRLEQEPLTLHEQACLAITLYEQRLEIPLPEKIKEKIFQLYEE